MIIRKVLKPLICVISIFIVTANAQHVMLFVRNSLLLCYNNVIPSLFVFMVLSSYLGQGQFVRILSLPFMWYSKLMKINDRKISSGILLSLLGGFAVGAGFLDEMQKSGYETNCIKAICPVLINNSMSFCVFAVGIGMLDNYYLGWMLFISLASASLITGFIMSFIYQYNIVSSKKYPEEKAKTFADCVTNSVKNILSICGYVIIFYALCKVIKLYISSKSIEIILSAVLEVTGGCAEIALNTGKNPFYICIALSILPISTLCQVFHFTQSADVIKTLIVSRIIHTPLSLMIFTIICNLFPVAAGALNPSSIAVRHFYNSFEISSTMFMIVLCFIVITDHNRIFTKAQK